MVDMYMKLEQTGTNCDNHIAIAITLKIIQRYRLNQNYI